MAEVRMLTEDEARELFERAVRKRTGMSVEAFLEWFDVEPKRLEEVLGHSTFIHLYMLLPLVR